MRHKHADLIHAWADGAKIQWESHYGDWIDENHPNWSEHNKYRIKPKPKTDFVRYCHIPIHWGDFEKRPDSNIKIIFDGETMKAKSAEVIK